MSRRLRMRRVSAASLAAWLLAACAAAAAPAEGELARRILDATAVKGGLVVHVGCGDGKLTAALHAGDSFLVHGLDADPARVAKARAHVRSLGLYGAVAIDRLEGTTLPYTDGLVNLVVMDAPARVAMAEVMRVLAPNGVAYVNAGGWKKAVKPRPKNIDEWTHYLYDASNNAVGHDQVVGPPRRLQWVGSPRWSRHHDHMASMSALVSANGRLFYIMDLGSKAAIQLPPDWWLIARDAFNGTVLWKRPIAAWNTHRWALKSGPAQLPRRLVAVGDTVFVTMALDAPVTALDAATGKTLRTYKGTANTEEIIASDGVLFLMVSPNPSTWPAFRQRFAYVWDNTREANKHGAWDEQARRIVAVQADTGQVLWEKKAPVAPLALAADATRVCYHDGERIVALARRTGKEQWRSEPVARRSPIASGFGPTLVLYRDVVLFAGGTRTMTALAAATGKALWTGKHHRGGHMSPEDLLVLDGVAWSGQIAGGGDSGVFTGYDVRTGKVRGEFTPDVKTYWFHHRCHRSKATDRFILASRTGIEFVDPKTQHWEAHHWVRGGCIYGVMPSNGLVYAPPHSCGCYLESKLCGFNALAPAPARPVAERPAARRLVKGPAYGGNPEPGTWNPEPVEWPTYRHDGERSGSTTAAVPASLKQAWQAKLGGRLSSVVVAGGKLFVATVDDHTLHALDAKTGAPAWAFIAGGRIDSPPTIWQGRCLFGSADGWVYCLRAADGALAWRFLAGPDDRRHVAYEQVESVWPVHGSVLVQGGVACFVAGRSVFLDGGMRLYRLDAKTGRQLSMTAMDDKDPESGKNLQVHVKGLTMPVALPDILSSDGKRLYMRTQRFDMAGKRLAVAPEPFVEQVGDDAHIFCQVGLLDDSWFHRSYWLFGRAMGGGYGGWFQAARYAPWGRLLVFDDARVYGYGRRPEYITNSSVFEYLLYAADRKMDPDRIQEVRRSVGRMNARSRRRNGTSSDWRLRSAFPLEQLSAVRFRWMHEQPSVIVRAMVKAGDTLFVAGPPDVIDERRSFRLPDDEEVQAKLRQQRDAWAGKLGGRLWAVAAADGKPAARYRLDAVPVFDGMAAAYGRLYVATADGRVLCLAGDGATALPLAGEPVQTRSAEPPLEPDYLRPPEVRKDKDFSRVVNCAVLQAKLGYALRGNERNRFGYAVNKLDKPLTQRAQLKTTFRTVQAGQGRFLINGLLAFGDGAKDEQLIKCGVRLQAQSAFITQGTYKDGKQSSKPLEISKDGLVPLTVTVDLKAQKVTLTVKNVTVEAPLARPLKAVTHVGYAVDAAYSEFGPVDIAGK